MDKVIIESVACGQNKFHQNVPKSFLATKEYVTARELSVIPGWISSPDLWSASLSRRVSSLA